MYRSEIEQNANPDGLRERVGEIVGDPARNESVIEEVETTKATVEELAEKNEKLRERVSKLERKVAALDRANYDDRLEAVESDTQTVAKLFREFIVRNKPNTELETVLECPECGIEVQIQRPGILADQKPSCPHCDYIPASATEFLQEQRHTPG